MQKRERPDWEEFFMFSALVAASRSSCLRLQTGAVVVKDKRIIASGYNGAPQGIQNCLERGCRKREYGVDFEDKGKSICRGTHAEINAMNQIARADLKGAKLYTIYSPCTPCAKVIVNNGIGEVIYYQLYREQEPLAKELFKETGITLRQMDLDIEKYIRNLKDITALMSPS